MNFEVNLRKSGSGRLREEKLASCLSVMPCASPVVVLDDSLGGASEELKCTGQTPREPSANKEEYICPMPEGQTPSAITHIMVSFII